MNIVEYNNYHETKSHVDASFPYNTYLCTIPLDFTQVPTHWHDEMELIVIKKGSGIVVIDLVSYQVTQGSIILILSGQLHSIAQLDSNTMEYENILFQFSMLFPKDFDLCMQDYFIPFLQGQFYIPSILTKEQDYYDALMDCINQIDHICSLKSYAYQIAIKGYLYQFFYILFHNNQKKIMPQALNKHLEKIKQILKYVEDHYSDPITIQEIAALSGFSSSHFMKFFKMYIGTSFIEYLNDYRLSISARLLLSSNCSILEIAAETGFDNLSYFNRLFKKKYLTTPSNYRKARTE